MKCPHCSVQFHDEPEEVFLGEDVDGAWAVVKMLCPNPRCKRLIFMLVKGPGEFDETSGEWQFYGWERSVFVRPRGINRPPVPPEVPEQFAEDYREACLVLADSAKASAALSRRCVQHLLREKAGVEPGNLADEIQQLLDSRQLPPYLAEAIDAIRNYGNFAAHPIKSQKTGEIVAVEPGEAEWTLEVLERLFDFYFVQPEDLRQKREALNKKLEDTGKPKMKRPAPPAEGQ